MEVDKESKEGFAMGDKKADGPKIKTVKMSLTVAALLQWRLTTLANRLGRDRSDFAAELLDQGLARYTFDKELRKLAPPEFGEAESAA
jgi:hypothetical protein